METLGTIILIFVILLLILAIFGFMIWEHAKLCKDIKENIEQTKSMFSQWVDGLAKVSGIPKDRLMNMPLSEVEKLRGKYNYK